MSIFKVNKGDYESFTIVTNPLRHYTSSSTQGSTGSVHVFARRSDREKESAPLASFVEATHNDADLESMLRHMQHLGRYARVTGSSAPFILTASARFPNMCSEYLDKVNEQGVSARKQKKIEIIRFTPTSTFTSNTIRKMVTKDILHAYYRVSYPSAHWAYSNYNCLSFFTSSMVPTSSVLLYPNIDGGLVHDGYVSGTYTPSGSFSFDFYINPRYRPDQVDGHFKAGTLLHLSSTFALSLVTGSAKNENGLPLGFRMQLQLSHSADIAPSLAIQGSHPSDMVFLSDDNALAWNRWQHVVVRWGTNLMNEGTGSFNIDGVDRGYFVVPSGTIAPRSFPAGGLSSPDVLCVGNFWEGTNRATASIGTFFAADPAEREGLQVMYSDIGIDEPGLYGNRRYAFNHPLNADIHDLSIKRYYMTDVDLEASASVGPLSIDSDWVSFYLPPFFVEESPFRKFVGTHGGILQTPFEEVDGSTDDPFNAALSFGVAGHYINIENFLRDFASNVYPRAHHMSGVAINNTSELRSANDFLYEQPFVRRRNLLLMPCDDGLFVPSYELLASESRRSNAVDDLGIEELSFINLDNMILTTSLLFGSDFDGDTTFVDEAIGFTPEQPGNVPGPASIGFSRMIDDSVASGTFDPGLANGAPLTVFQRTHDPSSNQITFFDISNMYYGKRILPKSFVLSDSGLSGSGGATSITLRDDGYGTIYRADSLTSASTWNSVGTIFYDEGIVVIKSPHLYFFGKEGFEVSFRGEQNVHVLHFDVVAGSNQLNSSSNPNFMKVAPSPFRNDPEKEFVYITGINFHDDNLNVIMKTQLAQPIMKRHGDRILFKVRHDF